MDTAPITETPDEPPVFVVTLHPSGQLSSFLGGTAAFEVTADELEVDGGICQLITADEIVATFPHAVVRGIVRKDALVEPPRPARPEHLLVGDTIAIGPSRALYRITAPDPSGLQLELVADED